MLFGRSLKQLMAEKKSAKEIHFNPETVKEIENFLKDVKKVELVAETEILLLDRLKYKNSSAHRRCKYWQYFTMVHSRLKSNFLKNYFSFLKKLVKNKKGKKSKKTSILPSQWYIKYILYKTYAFCIYCKQTKSLLQKTVFLIQSALLKRFYFLNLSIILISSLSRFNFLFSKLREFGMELLRKISDKNSYAETVVPTRENSNYLEKLESFLGPLPYKSGIYIPDNRNDDFDEDVGKAVDFDKPITTYSDSVLETVRDKSENLEKIQKKEIPTKKRKRTSNLQKTERSENLEKIQKKEIPKKKRKRTSNERKKMEESEMLDFLRETDSDQKKTEKPKPSPLNNSIAAQKISAEELSSSMQEALGVLLGKKRKK